MTMDTIGLIAGNGKFPILFAQAARRQQMRVVAAAIQGDTSLLLRPFVDKMTWFKVGELEKLFHFFKEEGIKQVIMAGQVDPKNLFDERIKLDGEFQKLFEALKDRKADTIFNAIADKLKEHGLELLDSTLLLKEYIARATYIYPPKPSLRLTAPAGISSWLLADAICMEIWWYFGT